MATGVARPLVCASAAAEANAALSGAALDPGLPQREGETTAPPPAGGLVRSPAGEVPQQSAAFGSTAAELGALAASLQQGWLSESTDAAEPDER